jgi:hypothetical protein
MRAAQAAAMIRFLTDIRFHLFAWEYEPVIAISYIHPNFPFLTSGQKQPQTPCFGGNLETSFLEFSGPAF